VLNLAGNSIKAVDGISSLIALSELNLRYGVRFRQKFPLEECR
jgi:hypothetical protein